MENFLITTNQLQYKTHETPHYPSDRTDRRTEIN